MPNDSLPATSPASSWALSIPRVLESVLEKMNNKNLFRCRLVCQSWAKEAGRIIGKRIVGKVTALDQLETLRKIQICSDISIPVKTLRVEILDSFDTNQSSSQSFCGVTSLDLRCSPSLVPHFLENVFPNLESLYLNVPYHALVGLVASSAVVWENGTLPRLRNLQLHDCLDRDWMSFVYKLLEKADKLECIDVSPTSAIANIFASVCSSSLKSITVPYSFPRNISATFFTALNNHPIIFPLETIDLEAIDIGTVSKSDIKLLLTRFSSTLSQLKLGFNGMFEMNFPIGVPMKKLRTLRLIQFRGSMEWRNLPYLKKLDVYYSSIEGIAASISSTPAHCHLEALKIHGTKDDDDNFILFFREIAEYLGPQLIVLVLVKALCQPLLPVIFTKLTQLIHLTLLANDDVSVNITNNDLCGGDSFTFERPREGTHGSDLKNLYKRMIESAKKSNHARGPNITNLKDLQFLSMDGTFDEVAVLHGIVQCEKLRELNLDFPDDETRDSIVPLLVNAGLEHLTRAELDFERINHLSFCSE